MPRRSGTPRDLREDCVREALSIIERDGVEALSLREVARRLGVSHQAPYRHYPSRDHLLAEVVRRAFTAFAEHLDARPRHGEPAADLEAMGRAYLDYAMRHPLQYRLIFGTPLPPPEEHPEMMPKGRYAFGQLEEAIRALDGARAPDARAPDPRLDALHVWALLHGLATLAQSSALKSLGFVGPMITTLQDHTMARLDRSLHAPLAGTPGMTAGKRQPAGTAPARGVGRQKAVSPSSAPAGRDSPAGREARSGRPTGPRR